MAGINGIGAFGRHHPKLTYPKIDTRYKAFGTNLSPHRATLRPKLDVAGDRVSPVG